MSTIQETMELINAQAQEYWSNTSKKPPFFDSCINKFKNLPNEGDKLAVKTKIMTDAIKARNDYNISTGVNELSHGTTGDIRTRKLAEFLEGLYKKISKLNVWVGLVVLAGLGMSIVNGKNSNINSPTS